jgi:hypothetical protein
LEVVKTFLLVILLILLLGLSGGLGDTVQITLAGLRDAAATLLLVVLNDANLLEGLEDLAVNRAGGVDVVRGTVATVLGGTVDAAETADTDGLAEVDVTSHGGGADVEPVNVLGRELLGDTSLDGIDPTRNGQLALTLQEVGIGLDEFLRLEKDKPISMIPSSEILRPPRACSSFFQLYVSSCGSCSSKETIQFTQVIPRRQWFVEKPTATRRKHSN